MKSRECKWFQVCPMKYYFDKGELDEKWINNYCRGEWKSCVRYQKEEAGIYHEDNMLPNGQINKNLR